MLKCLCSYARTKIRKTFKGLNYRVGRNKKKKGTVSVFPFFLNKHELDRSNDPHYIPNIQELQRLRVQTHKGMCSFTNFDLFILNDLTSFPISVKAIPTLRKEHLFFHRSLSYIIKTAFEAGFVLDGLEEIAFPRMGQYQSIMVGICSTKFRSLLDFVL